MHCIKHLPITLQRVKNTNGMQPGSFISRPRSWKINWISWYLNDYAFYYSTVLFSPQLDSTQKQSTTDTSENCGSASKATENRFIFHFCQHTRYSTNLCQCNFTYTVPVIVSYNTKTASMCHKILKPEQVTGRKKTTTPFDKKKPWKET